MQSDSLSTRGTSAAPPLIAAVVFSYNYARYLREAINSLLEQDHPFDQLLVIDDGSTDESGAIINSYRNRVEAVFQENRGQLGAARTALQHLRCDYVYFLDADDYAEPGARQLISEHLRDNPVKVQFQLRGVDNNGQLDSVIPAYPSRYGSDDMIADNQSLGFYISPPTSGNVFSVAALRALDLDQLEGSEPFDGTPMLCMPYIGQVTSVSRVIANYRLHGENFSMQHSPSASQCERVLAQHTLRWTELTRLLPAVNPPRDGSTAIEREARCLMAPLSGQRMPLADAVGYAQSLRRTNLPARMKLLLSLYMLTVWALPASAATRLIKARRSPGLRSPMLNSVLRRILRLGQSRRD